MKKIYLAFMLTCAGLYNSNAQVNVGGFPWSLSHREIVANERVPLVRLNTPDFESAIKEDQAHPEKPGKYRVALAVDANISLNTTGVFTFMPDGSKIWRAQIAVPTSKGLKISYEKFQLPEGVTYFVQNGNRKQLIGGFDAQSNVPEKVMGHEMVQGDVVNLEMNIEPNVDINTIEFNIKKIYAVYRSAGYLNFQYGDNTEIVATIGDADACHINAICPQAAPWERLSKTVAHIWITDGETGGFCSGNLINNTRKDCTPLFLTASHCDGENATTNANFSQWEFTFGYKTPLCSGGGSPKDDKMIMGANFVARSDNPLNGATTGPLFGDFLLLQIKDPNQRLQNWDLYLAGWDRSGIKSNDSVWVSFHHPAGDVMKFTKMRPLDSLGSFNTDSAGTHWAARQVMGGSQGGSSGSGLFRGSTGMLIGDLSGGSGSACATNRANLYSKISYDWEYPKGDNTPATRLKEHLDPIGNGAMSMEMAKLGADCPSTPFRLGTLSVSDVNELQNGLIVYPNPSNGNVRLKVNLAEQTTLTVNVYNVLGTKCGTFNVKSIRTGEVILDLSNQPAGVYALEIASDKASVSKKIVINK